MATPTEGDGELEQTVKLTTQELDDEDELDNGSMDSENGRDQDKGGTENKAEAPAGVKKSTDAIALAEQRRQKRMAEAAARRKAEEEELEQRTKRKRTIWGRMYLRYLDKKRAVQEARELAAKEAAERAHQEMENDRMEWEERLTWHAYELQVRNLKRMREEHAQCLAMRHEQEAKEAAAAARECEPGLAFHGAAVVGFERYRNAAALVQTLEGHNGEVLCVKVSSCLRYVLSGSTDTHIRLWSLGSGEWIHTYEGHEKAVRDVDLPVDFHSCNLFASCSLDKTVRIWDKSRPRRAKLTLRGHSDVVYRVCFSPNGRVILSASEDGTMRAWDRHEGYTLWVYRGHTAGVTCCAYSPTGRFIVSGSAYDENGIKLWYAKLPVVYKPQRVGMVVHWHPSGLVKAITLWHAPRDDFFLENTDDKDSGDSEEEEERKKREDEENRKKKIAVKSKRQKEKEREDRKKQREEERVEKRKEEAKEKKKQAQAEGGAAGEAEAKEEEDEGNDADGEAEEEGGEQEEVEDANTEAERSGFSMQILALDRLGRTKPTRTYYPGQTLRVAITGGKAFRTFFISAYREPYMYSIFEKESGERVGVFRRHDRLSVGVKLTCKGHGVQNLRDRDIYEAMAEWTAPSHMGVGVGTVVFKASIKAPDSKPGQRRFYTLQAPIAEEAPPDDGNSHANSSAAAAAAAGLARRLDFSVAERHNMLLDLLEGVAGRGPNPNNIPALSCLLAARVKLTYRDGRDGKETKIRGADVVGEELKVLAGRMRVHKQVRTMVSKPQSRVMLLLEDENDTHSASGGSAHAALPSPSAASPPHKQQAANPQEDGHPAPAPAAPAAHSRLNCLAHKKAETTEHPKPANEGSSAPLLPSAAAAGSTAPPAAGQGPPPATEAPTNAAPVKGGAGAQKGKGAIGSDEAMAQAEVERILAMRRRKWAIAEEVRMVNMPLAPGRMTPPYPAESLTPRFGFTEYPEMCMPYPVTYPSCAQAYELDGNSFSKMMAGAQKLIAAQRSSSLHQEQTPEELYAEVLAAIQSEKQQAAAKQRRPTWLKLPGVVPHPAVEGRQVDDVASLSTKGSHSAPHDSISTLTSIAGLDASGTEKHTMRPTLLSRLTGIGPAAGSESGAPGVEASGTAAAGKTARPTLLARMTGGTTKTLPGTMEASGMDKPGVEGSGPSPLTVRPTLLARLTTSGTVKALPPTTEAAGTDRPAVEASGNAPPAVEASGAAGKAVRPTLLAHTTGKKTFRRTVAGKGPSSEGQGTSAKEEGGVGEREKDPAGSAMTTTAAASGFRRRTEGFDVLPGLEVHVSPRGGPLDDPRYWQQVKARAIETNGLLLTFRTHRGEGGYGMGVGHSDAVTQVVFSGDERRVASSSHDGTVRVWDPLDGSLVRVLQQARRGAATSSPVYGLSFAANGLHIISCGSDRQVVVWDVVTGEVVKRLHGHDNIVYACHFYRNANAMATCSADATIRLWALTPDVPAQVKALKVTNKGQSFVELKWAVPPAYNDDIIAFRIGYRVNKDVLDGGGDDSPFGLEIGVSPLCTSARVPKLSAGTAYQFRVRAVNHVGPGIWSQSTPEVITDVGLPDELSPRPQVLCADTGSISLLFRSACDMHAVAATHSFVLQAEGADCPFNDALDKARVQRATWADAVRDAYEYSVAHPSPPLLDLLFPVDACTRRKQEEEAQRLLSKSYWDVRDEQWRAEQADIARRLAETAKPLAKTTPAPPAATGMAGTVVKRPVSAGVSGTLQRLFSFSRPPRRMTPEQQATRSREEALRQIEDELLSSIQSSTDKTTALDKPDPKGTQKAATIAKTPTKSGGLTGLFGTKTSEQGASKAGPGRTLMLTQGAGKAKATVAPTASAPAPSKSTPNSPKTVAPAAQKLSDITPAGGVRSAPVTPNNRRDAEGRKRGLLPLPTWGRAKATTSASASATSTSTAAATPKATGGKQADLVGCFPSPGRSKGASKSPAPSLANGPASPAPSGPSVAPVTSPISPAAAAAPAVVPPLSPSSPKDLAPRLASPRRLPSPRQSASPRTKAPHSPRSQDGKVFGNGSTLGEQFSSLTFDTALLSGQPSTARSQPLTARSSKAPLNDGALVSTSPRTARKKEEKEAKREVDYTELDGRRYKLLLVRFTGLNPGEMYRFRIAPINSAAPAKPLPPRVASATLRSLTLKWKAPHENGSAITGWILWLGHTNMEIKFGRFTVMHTVENLEPGTGYIFKIRALNCEGPSEWSDLSPPLCTIMTPPEAPPAPRILAFTATPVSVEVEIELPFHNGSPITHFVIQRRQLNNFNKTKWGCDVTVDDVEARFATLKSRDPGKRGRKAAFSHRVHGTIRHNALPGDTLPGTPGQTGTLARTTGGRSPASSQPSPMPSARQEGPTTAELLGSTAELPKADGELLPANLKRRAERKAAFANEWANAYDPLPGNSTRALRFTVKGVGNGDTRELTNGHERDGVKNDNDNERENEDTHRMRTTLAATSRVALFGESSLKRPSKSAMPIFPDGSLNMRTTRALYASTRHGILMDEQPEETYRSTLVVMTELNAATVYDFRVAAANIKGLGEWSVPSQKVKTLPAQPPPAPPKPTVLQVATTSVLLRWEAPAFLGAATKCFIIKVYEHVMRPIEVAPPSLPMETTSDQPPLETGTFTPILTAPPIIRPPSPKPMAIEAVSTTGLLAEFGGQTTGSSDSVSVEPDKASTQPDVVRPKAVRMSLDASSGVKVDEAPAADAGEKLGGEKRPATAEKRPGTAEAARPGSAERRPSTAEKRPATAEKRPATAETRPPTGEKRPATAEKRPGTAGERPTTAEKRPGTAEGGTAESQPEGEKAQPEAPQEREEVVFVRNVEHQEVTATELRVRGLESGSKYSFTVLATNSKGQGEESPHTEVVLCPVVVEPVEVSGMRTKYKAGQKGPPPKPMAKMGRRK